MSCIVVNVLFCLCLCFVCFRGVNLFRFVCWLRFCFCVFVCLFVSCVFRFMFAFALLILFRFVCACVLFCRSCSVDIVLCLFGLCVLLL